MKIKNFTDLMAWRESHKLVKEIYKVTNTFPRKEDYALTSQMRRSAISVSSNIAEGFGRRTRKEKVQFYFMSNGSLIELQNQIIISCSVGYFDKEEKDMLFDQTIVVSKLINGLIKGVEKIHNS